MSQPVIIDDGGSIRIRQITNTNDGLMNGLTFAPFTDNAPDTFHANAHGVLCYLTVRYFEANGAGHNYPADPGQAVSVGDSVLIDGGNGQTITITFPGPGPAVAMTIQVNAIAATVVQPLRNRAGNWRYTVTNADIMQTVIYTPSGGMATTLFNAADTPAIFTMVHFKPS